MADNTQHWKIFGVENKNIAYLEYQCYTNQNLNY